MDIKQCCTCEHVFKKSKEFKCPECNSGNWVFGYLDDAQEIQDAREFNCGENCQSI